MIRILVGLIMIGLITYVFYHRVTSVPLDARSTIDVGLDQVKESSDLDPAQEQWLRVQLSIRDYEASHGSAPESLEQLVPEYFDEVPRDPQTSEVYAYSAERGVLLGVGPGEDASAVRVASAASSDKEDLEGLEKVTDIENFVNPNTMELDDFVYNPKGKRNPFVPFDFSESTAIDPSIPPLQRYSLGQLVVTAILGESEGRWTAIVEDASGRGYPVRQGTKIGNANGEVVSIEKDRLNVVERTIDFTGEEKQRVVVMKIQKGTSQSGKKKKRRRRR